MSEEEQIILPERYKRVSYLADTGLQWIDTEYVPTNDTGLWIDAQQIVHSNGHVMGSGIDINSPADGFTAPRWLKSTGNTAGYGWGGWKSWGTISDGSRFVSSLNFNNDKKALLTTIGETSQSFTGDLTDLTFTPTKSIFLFTTNKDGNSHTYPWKGRIYEAKISEGTTIVRHFIPAYDLVDKAACMYDVIEQKAYYNKGTSRFAYSFDDVPRELLYSEEEIKSLIPDDYKRVDYLYFSGNHYINTGVTITNKIGCKIKYTRTKPFGTTDSDSANPMGCRPITSGNNCWVPPNMTASAKEFYVHYGTSTSIKANPPMYGELFTIYDVEHNLFNCCKSSVNGTVIAEYTNEQFTEDNYCTYPLHLGTFVLNTEVYNTYNWQGKIYNCIITDDREIIRYYVPCLDENNKPCMFDIVNQTTHYNDSTGGDFGYGNDDKQFGVFGELPEGFTRLNHLIASGTQYINTSYVPTNETGYYLEGQGSTNDTSYFFGSNETSKWEDNKRIYCCATPNVNWGWMTCGALTSADAYRRQETKISFNFLNDRIVKATINETNFTYNLPELNFEPTRNIHLFGVNLADTQNHLGLKGRIDTFLISEGDQIVRQFVPCLDEDGIPCMYELYTGTVHYNQGTGQFSYPRIYTNAPINLPAGYTKCVYLQSNGTQWIDTGVIPNNETGVYVKAQRLNYGDFNNFGSWMSSSAYFYPPHFNTTTKSGIWSFGTTYQLCFYYDKGDDLIYTSTMNLYNDRTVNLWSEDTNWTGVISVVPSVTFTRPLWLFSYNMNDTSIDATYAKWGGRIFRAKITQGDTLVHDFVPCLDENKRPCMYDLVAQTPFYNQSGGEEFVYCVEQQLPSDFIKLKYLESTGTQYIKTGYVPTNTTGIYVDAYNNWATKTTYTLPIGLRETNGNTYIFVGRVLRESTGAGYGWGAVTTPGGTGNVRYEASLNFLNDRQSIITAPAFAQRINSLSDLSFTPTIDLCMFGYHNYDGKYYSAGYRLYRAKISEGSEIVRDWFPAYDQRTSRPCMFDIINSKAYYNDGENEFLYNNDYEGTYTGFSGLGGIGNRLGYNDDPNGRVALPYGYTKVDFLESTGKEYINTNLRAENLSLNVSFKSFVGGGGDGNGVCGCQRYEVVDGTGHYHKQQVLTQGHNYGVGYISSMRYMSKNYGVSFSDSPINLYSEGEINLKNLTATITVENLGTKTTNLPEILRDLYVGIMQVFRGPQGGHVGHIYSFSANYDGVPAANYIPAIDPDGVPCMYDTVTERPFYNNGTGQFIVGLKTLSQAVSLRLPDIWGSIQLSLPTNDKIEYYEERIRNNNPNWTFTFFYHD